MSTRRTWTPAEMRTLAKAGGTDISIGQMRGALAYAADVVESGAAVIAEYKAAEPPHQPTGYLHPDRVSALIAVLEGECDGLAVSRTTAEAILHYVDGNAPQPADERESSAELALRRLAIWLGVGVDNGPIVDFRGLEEKIRWSVAYLIDANAAPLPAEGDQHD